MPKPRPIEVHVNSSGKKKYKLQELIHSSNGFAFLPIDGKKKTDLFNKGFLDGRKQPVPLEPTYESCSGTNEVLAFSIKNFSDKVKNLYLVGVVPLDQTYLINSHESDRFLASFCSECEYSGMHNCFSNDFPCADADREKYKDGSWFELKKEVRKERKSFAFPVKG
ncbi:hypothetical protein QYF50_06385 [Paenibacillus vini]|uniref:hypothetical protein n=1 Tax=Paenibacillus vini TaxID=1476024 RepID=UPI0025B69472|nr:hypothetical protein [Paenibacillus vini]MDN4067518.1 hypothetical protein [Paenibacillus vini]